MICKKKYIHCFFIAMNYHEYFKMHRKWKMSRSTSKYSLFEFASVFNKKKALIAELFNISHLLKCTFPPHWIVPNIRMMHFKWTLNKIQYIEWMLINATVCYLRFGGFLPVQRFWVNSRFQNCWCGWFVWFQLECFVVRSMMVLANFQLLAKRHLYLFVGCLHYFFDCQKREQETKRKEQQINNSSILITNE